MKTSNLLLRLVLCTFAVLTTHFYGGDTGAYVTTAQSIANGEWGGDPIRPPLYSWLLYLFSLRGILIVQVLSIWCAGLFLERWSKRVSFFWYFDPVLLVYGCLVMSDALFGVGMLCLAVVMNQMLIPAMNRITLRSAIGVGMLLGLLTLLRNIGMPLALFTLIFLLARVVQSRLKLLHWSAAILVFVAVLAPRVYWNGTMHAHWTVAVQDSGWIESVAGVVENYGTGLDPRESELKYLEDHPARNAATAYRVIGEHLPVWALLSVKGVARVLIGHVNVEWTQLWTGQSPIGPGWFKVKEKRNGVHVQGYALIPWVLGILFVASWCVYVYAHTTISLIRYRVRNRKWDSFIFWSLGAIAILVFIPQLWGDARFRIGVWSLVLMLWAWSSRNAKIKAK